jgi:hypothetical protein
MWLRCSVVRVGRCVGVVLLGLRVRFEYDASLLITLLNEEVGVGWRIVVDQKN